jgi:hypothetical protein
MAGLGPTIHDFDLTQKKSMPLYLGMTAPCVEVKIGWYYIQNDTET